MMVRPKAAAVLTFALSVSAAICIGPAAMAASFDCTKTIQPVEKAICGDLELSKLDDDLAAGYRQAQAALSPEGRKILRDGQRAWLGFARKLCGGLPLAAPSTAEENTPDTLTECLKSEYRERLEELQQASERHGRFLFSRVDSFALAKSDPTLPSARPGFAYRRLSWPRIDRIEGAAPDQGAAWNKAVAGLAHKLGGEDNGTAANGATTKDALDVSDLDLTYSFGLVTPELISLQMNVFEFAHGAAHPNGASQMQNLFVTTGRAMRPIDLFRADKDWSAYLVRRSRDGWRKILTDGQGDDAETIAAAPEIDDKAIATVVNDPQNWLLTDAGISINFPLYSIGPYVLGEQQIEVTWDELKPYLVDPLPFTRP